MRKAHEFYLVSTLIISLSGTTMAGSLEDRRHEKLLEQGLLPFQTDSEGASICSVSGWDQFKGFVGSLFSANPTERQIEESQLRAIDLIKKLQDPQSFETLMRIQDQEGVLGSSYPAAVRWSATATLLEFMPVLTEKQRTLFLQSLLAKRTAQKLSPEESQMLEPVILRVWNHVKDPTSVAAIDNSEIHLSEARAGFADMALDLPLVTAEMAIDSPLKAPTRFAWGILSSFGSAICDFPANLAGCVTDGAYGNCGREYGASVANEAAWLTPAIGARKRVTNGIKTGIDYTRLQVKLRQAGVTEKWVQDVNQLRHDFMNSTMNMISYKRLLGYSLPSEVTAPLERAIGKFNAAIKPLESTQQMIFDGQFSALRDNAPSLIDDARASLPAIKNALDDLAQQDLLKLAEGDLAAEAPKYVQEARRSVDQMDDMLRTFGKSDLLWFTVSTLEKEVASFLESQITDKITFSTEMATATDFIRVNPKQFGRVLNNLVINAKEAGATEITFRSDWQFDHLGLRLYVEDNGTGMDPAISKKIFKSGFSTKNRGSGEGLASCKNLVEAAGGKIWVETTSPEGTNFVIEFPRVEAPKPKFMTEETGAGAIAYKLVTTARGSAKLRMSKWVKNILPPAWELIQSIKFLEGTALKQHYGNFLIAADRLGAILTWTGQKKYMLIERNAPKIFADLEIGTVALKRGLEQLNQEALTGEMLAKVEKSLEHIENLEALLKEPKY